MVTIVYKHPFTGEGEHSYPKRKYLSRKICRIGGFFDGSFRGQASLYTSSCPDRREKRRDPGVSRTS
jgi:hypothetical protein